jgi:hypothetical protein
VTVAAAITATTAAAMIAPVALPPLAPPSELLAVSLATVAVDGDDSLPGVAVASGGAEVALGGW